MNRLVLTHPDMVAALGLLLAASAGAMAASRLGFNCTARGQLLLAGPFTLLPAWPKPAHEPSVITLSYRPDASQPEPEAAAMLRLHGPPARGQTQAALMWAGRGKQARCGGSVWRGGGHIEPLAEIQVVGPGLPILRPEEKRPQRHAFPERWSRLQGALGGPALSQLQNLRFTLLGCGRNGSLVATTLARMGARRLALVDPDRLEAHNLDAMDTVLPADVGRYKTDALAEGLCRISDNLEIRTFSGSLTALAALPLIQTADFLISCVDDDSARRAATALATIYLKPLLDIGTGVFGGGRLRELGADVRLTIPGESCLSCLGGFANALPASPRRDWRQERAGSLRSLNQMATGLAARLLEDFLTARLDGSRWLRLMFDANGAPSLETLRPTGNANCPLCARRGTGNINSAP